MRELPHLIPGYLSDQLIRRGFHICRGPGRHNRLGRPYENTHEIIQDDPYDSSDTVIPIESSCISTTETTAMISDTTNGNCQTRLIRQRPQNLSQNALFCFQNSGACRTFDRFFMCFRPQFFHKFKLWVPFYGFSHFARKTLRSTQACVTFLPSATSRTSPS